MSAKTSQEMTLVRQYALDVADIADAMCRLRGVVCILGLAGESGSVIDKKALTYTFSMIHEEINSYIEALYQLSDKMHGKEADPT